MHAPTSRWTLGVLGLALSVSLGCANSTMTDPYGKRTSLDESQRRYTELVRWGEIEMASVFVDPELLDEYLEYADAFRGIRFEEFFIVAAIGLESASRSSTQSCTLVVMEEALSVSTAGCVGVSLSGIKLYPGGPHVMVHTYNLQ